MSENTYETYGNYGSIFREKHLKYPFVASIEKELLANVKGDLLDIGTGDGFKLEYIASKNAGKIDSITAIEPSDLLASARKRFENKNLTLLQLDWKDFFIRDPRQFDTIVTFETLEHMHDQTGFIRAIKSRLKPGGKMICSTPNRPVYRLLCRIAREKPDPTHVGELSCRQLRDLFSMQFRKVQVKGFFPFMGLYQRMPAFDIVNKWFPFLWWSRTFYVFASD